MKPQIPAALEDFKCWNEQLRWSDEPYMYGFAHTQQSHIHRGVSLVTCNESSTAGPGSNIHVQLSHVCSADISLEVEQSELSSLWKLSRCQGEKKKTKPK